MLSRELDILFREAMLKEYGEYGHCPICDTLFSVNNLKSRFIAVVYQGMIQAELVCPDCSASNLAHYP